MGGGSVYLKYILCFSGLANVTSILKDPLFNRCIIFKVGWTCFNWNRGNVHLHVTSMVISFV